MQQKSIAVISCYMGPFPWYFDFFVHSCAYNPTVDFFIVSDNLDYHKTLPANVKLVYKTLSDIRILIEQKIGIKPDLQFAYKLCDFKPAYGVIFSELIANHDYWAQSDIDIIFGDIRGFITAEMLSEFDFISIRHDYTTGCFALYRNNEYVNNLFKKSKDYVMVFTSYEHLCFDECSFAHDSLTDGASIFEVDTVIESFTHVIRTLEKSNEIKAHFDFILIEGVTGRIMFDKGRVIYKKQFEGILYHLYWLKRDYKPIKVRKNIPETYYISPTRIYFKRPSVL